MTFYAQPIALKAIERSRTLTPDDSSKDKECEEHLEKAWQAYLKKQVHCRSQGHLSPTDAMKDLWHCEKNVLISNYHSWAANKKQCGGVSH